MNIFLSVKHVTKQCKLKQKRLICDYEIIIRLYSFFYCAYREKYRWQALPLRIRPAMPGSGYFSVPDKHFAWSLFSGIEGRAIAQNIFLDGNTFSSSPSVNKKRFVADANAGISLTYGNIQTAFTLNWRSKEFYNQKNTSFFGALSVGYRF